LSYASYAGGKPGDPRRAKGSSKAPGSASGCLSVDGADTVRVVVVVVVMVVVLGVPLGGLAGNDENLGVGRG
jgi:hypothetical protein